MMFPTEMSPTEMPQTRLPPTTATQPRAFPRSTPLRAVSVLLCLGVVAATGCKAPVPLTIQLWMPDGQDNVVSADGFDISIPGAATSARLNRETDGNSIALADLIVPEEGLAVDRVIVRSVIEDTSDAANIATGRTGAATLLPDGTSSPAALSAVFATAGVHELSDAFPVARNDAAVCGGAFGRAYVLGGSLTVGGPLATDGAFIDPAQQAIVDAPDHTPRDIASCAAVGDADGDTVWLAGGCNADTPIGFERSVNGAAFETIQAGIACQTRLAIANDILWVLADDIIQARSVDDGSILASELLATSHLGGDIFATEEGAFVGGGREDNNALFGQIEFATFNGTSISLTSFGPDNVQEVSFTRDFETGTTFALIVAENTQVHELRPQIQSAPVEYEEAFLTSGNFNTPRRIASTPNGGFVVLDDGNTLREIRSDNSITDFIAAVQYSYLLPDEGGAIRILGKVAGVKVYVQAASGTSPL